MLDFLVQHTVQRVALPPFHRVCIDLYTMTKKEVVFFVDEITRAGFKDDATEVHFPTTLLSRIACSQQALVLGGCCVSFVVSAHSTRELCEFHTDSRQPLLEIPLPLLVGTEDLKEYITDMVQAGDIDDAKYKTELDAHLKDKAPAQHYSTMADAVSFQFRHHAGDPSACFPSGRYPGALVYRHALEQTCLCGGHPRRLSQLSSAFKNAVGPAAKLSVFVPGSGPTLDRDVVWELLRESILCWDVDMQHSYKSSVPGSVGPTLDMLASEGAVIFTSASPLTNTAKIRVSTAGVERLERHVPIQLTAHRDCPFRLSLHGETRVVPQDVRARTLSE